MKILRVKLGSIYRKLLLTTLLLPASTFAFDLAIEPVIDIGDIPGIIDPCFSPPEWRPSFCPPPPPPPVPTINASSSDTDGTYDLTLAPIPGGAMSFVWQEQRNGGSFSTLAFPYAIASFSGKSDATYGYRVKACNFEVCSSWSAVKAVAVYRPPGNVGFLSGPSSDIDGRYTLSWGAPSGTVTNYRVYRSGGGAKQLVQSSSSRSLSQSGLTDGVYYYEVIACNPAACSASAAAKSVLVVRTPAIPSVSLGGLSHPTTGQDAEGAYSTSWKVSGGIATSYQLQESINGGSFSIVQSGAASSKSFSGKSEGLYSYRARACNTLSCSAWSSVKSLQVLRAPGVTGAIVGPLVDTDGHFELTWYPASGTVTAYQLERNSNGAWSRIQTNVSTRRNEQVGNGTHSYRVRACNLTCSAWSPTTSVAVGINGGPGTIASSEAYKVPLETKVNHFGGFSAAVPIEVPKGINDMEPDISLKYGQQGERSYDPRRSFNNHPSFIGGGWELEGISVISWCRQSSAEYCLDGEQLKMDYGAPAGFYRPMGAPETLVQLKYDGSNQKWFEMKSGALTFRYGKTAEGRVAGTNTTPGYWYLQEIEDEFNNRLTLRYEPSGSTGLIQPKEILYGGHRIEFGYQPRREFFGVGERYATANILAAIRTYSNGKLLRNYSLHHQFVNSYEVMSGLQMCAYDPAGARTCARPMSMDWQYSAGIFGLTQPSVGIYSITDSMGLVTRLVYGDFVGAQEQGPEPSLAAWAEAASKMTEQYASNYLFAGSPVGEWTVIAMERDYGNGHISRTTYDRLSYGVNSAGHTAQLIHLPDGNKVYELYPSNYRLQMRQTYDGLYQQGGTLQSMRYFQYAMKMKDNCQLNCQKYQVYTQYPTTDADYIIGESGELLGAVIRTDEITGWDGSRGLVIQRTATTTTGYDLGGTLTQLSTIESRERLVTDYGNNIAVHDTARWFIGFPSRITTEHSSRDRSGVKKTIQVNTRAPGASGPNGTKSSLKVGHSSFHAERNGGLVEIRTVNNTYDGFGNLISTTTTPTDYPGDFQKQEYNSFLDDRFPQHSARLLSPGLYEDTFYNYNRHLGLADTITDANGQTTTKHFDAFGREIKTILSNSAEITTRYQPCDASCPTIGGIPAVRKETVTTTNPLSAGIYGAPQIITYTDASGRTLREETQGFSPTQRVVVDTIYDRAGRIDKKSLPYSSGTPRYVDYHYDGRGRVWKTLNPDSSYVELDFAQRANGLQVTRTEHVVSPAGTRKFYRQTTANSRGLITQSIDGLGTGDAVVTDYEYDQMGNNDLVVINNDPATAVRSTFDYDGNATRISDPSAGTVDYEYDGLGQLRYQTDARGLVTEFDYDNAGRVVQRIDGMGSDKQVINTFTYDTRKIGMLSTKSSSNGFTEDYYYEDPRGIPYLTRTATDINVEGFRRSYSTQMTYDAFGRQQTQTYPSGFRVYTAYNPRGYAYALRENNQYGNVLSETTAVDDYGNATESALGYGAGRYATSRGYDPLTGQIESIRTGGGRIQDYSYKWWSNGSLHQRETRAVTDAVETFSYDDLNRLTGSVTGSRTLAYNYDLLGNITLRRDHSGGGFHIQGYQYDSGNPHRLQNVVVDGTNQSYAYDAGGNVTAINSAEAGNDRVISYGAFGKPVYIAKGTVNAGSLSNITAQETFAYGPDGARFMKGSRNAGGTDITLYLMGGAFEVIIPASGEHTAIEKTYAGSVLHIREVDLAGYDERLEFIHKDHLGSTDVITDEAGNVVTRDQFDPFGTRRNVTWTGPTDSPLPGFQNLHTSRGFTGHEQLDSVGLIHMNGRVYDPEIGRFISPDPIVQAPRYSQSYNRYAYVWNNPLGYIDPTGYATGSLIRGRSGVYCDNCTGGNPPPPPQGDSVTVQEVTEESENQKFRLIIYKDQKGGTAVCQSTKSCMVYQNDGVYKVAGGLADRLGGEISVDQAQIDSPELAAEVTSHLMSLISDSEVDQSLLATSLLDTINLSAMLGMTNFTGRKIMVGVLHHLIDAAQMRALRHVSTLTAVPLVTVGCAFVPGACASAARLGAEGAAVGSLVRAGTGQQVNANTLMVDGALGVVVGAPFSALGAASGGTLGATIWRVNNYSATLPMNLPPLNQ